MADSESRAVTIENLCEISERKRAFACHVNFRIEKLKMIQVTKQGIELKFDESVKVADLAARINRELGLSKTQLTLNINSQKIIVTGMLGVHGAYAYSIILDQVPEQNVSVNDITARTISVPCFVGYDDLKKVYDEVVAQR